MVETPRGGRDSPETAEVNGGNGGRKSKLLKFAAPLYALCFLPLFFVRPARSVCVCVCVENEKQRETETERAEVRIGRLVALVLRFVPFAQVKRFESPLLRLRLTCCFEVVEIYIIGRNLRLLHTRAAR